MTAPLACWRCEQPGHGWRECSRPPAKTRQEYDARITDILIRWDAGKGFSNTARKRIIETETAAWRKEKARKAG